MLLLMGLLAAASPHPAKPLQIIIDDRETCASGRVADMRRRAVADEWERRARKIERDTGRKVEVRTVRGDLVYFGAFGTVPIFRAACF